MGELNLAAGEDAFARLQAWPTEPHAIDDGGNSQLTYPQQHIGIGERIDNVVRVH